MGTSLLQALFLAASDYWHERLLSACAILGLAAILAPLLVLLGVHHGIISAMTERLLNDPRTLEITPVGSGKYGPEWFAELRALPGVAFVVPQTRSIAATINLSPLRPDGRQAAASGGSVVARQVVTPLTASAQGDPLLLRWKQPAVEWRYPPNDSGPDGREADVPERGSPAGFPVAGVVLSESTARKLGASAGALIEGRVDRVRAGKREAATLPLRVLSVLPAEAQGTDMLYVPLELLVATEDYRDGKAVPFLGWPGDSPVPAPAPVSAGRIAPASAPPPATDSPAATAISALEVYTQSITTAREFASFRLYANALDEVTPLWRWFQGRQVEVYVKAAEIETVQSLDQAFTVVFGLIAGAAVFGFTASTASSALAGVRRKSRSIGLMRLLGFQRGGILLFPVAQTTATGLFGSALAALLYAGVAASIDHLFAASLPGGEAVCSLPLSYLAVVFGVVLLLSALSSLSAAWQATTIEPSEVIRDV